MSAEEIPARPATGMGAPAVPRSTSSVAMFASTFVMECCGTTAGGRKSLLIVPHVADAVIELMPARMSLDACDVPAAHGAPWARTVKRQKKIMTDGPDSPAPLSFERHVRPLFREKDRDSMRRAFDLWSHSDVQAHQDRHLRSSATGQCPATAAGRRSVSLPSNAGSREGRCPEPGRNHAPERVATFERWIAGGSLP